MELVGTQKIAAPREKVWAALFDPEILKQCVPGCDAQAVETAASDASEADAASNPEPEAKKGWLGGIFGKASAALLIALGLLLPPCCLDGSHGDGFGADPFGVICRRR